MKTRQVIILGFISTLFSSCFLLLQDCFSDFSNNIALEIYDASGRNSLDTLNPFGEKLLNINDPDGDTVLFIQVSLPDDPTNNSNASFLRVDLQDRNYYKTKK